jgi:hypothetical protein
VSNLQNCKTASGNVVLSSARPPFSAILTSVCYHSVIQNLPLFSCGAVKYYSLRAVLFVIKNVPTIAQVMMLCVLFIYFKGQRAR